MIKRNKRNIGKEVQIIGHKNFNSRIGKVVGFRGDFSPNNPYVQVMVYSIHEVWDFPGKDLIVIENSILKNLHKVSGKQPEKLCDCGLYLIQENQEHCEICTIYKEKR